jgi:hypothetical protein
MLPTLSGCTSLDRQLRAAATVQGRAEARVTLPDWPDDCRQTEPHAPLVPGGEVRSALKRERAALARQNARTRDCADLYDDLQTQFSGTPQ